MGAVSVDIDLLRVCTAGSVDDGKSTLIGRLLHDSRSLMSDQLEAVQRTSADGRDRPDLALLTDGLRAEREQGITIDVAYRYFTTPNRSFILADTPGHAEYTRNMVTGASTADVAIVLVDARAGLIEQSHRHLAIAALLGIRQVVLAVNKMDLVAFDRAVFDGIVTAARSVAEELGVHTLHAIPVSALNGDNVVDRSQATPWYEGPPLLELLETIKVEPPEAAGPLRLAVQWVIRVGEQRRYCGRISGGSAQVGDEVTVLPSMTVTTITAIHDGSGAVRHAGLGRSVSVELADDVDVGRGSLLGPVGSVPTPGRELRATVCWLGRRPAAPGDRLMLKHTTTLTPVVLSAIEHRLDVTTLAQTPADGLVLNDIATVLLRTAAPLGVDRYRDNRTTGSAILIDQLTNDTVGALMFL